MGANNLSLAIKQSNEIIETANSLSLKLKEMAFVPPEVVQVGADALNFDLTIFTLACFVGYYVVWKVTPALHTPLMSLTNAISGIIIVGALISGAAEKFDVSSLLGLIAVFLASINIFGGFMVTERMLEMFKKK